MLIDIQQQHQLKAMPLDVMAVMLLGTTNALVEAHMRQQIHLDQATIEQATSSCWYAIALAVLKLERGDTILIGGAAGGVGIFAIQLARLAWANVIGTGSASSFDYLRDLGAELVATGKLRVPIAAIYPIEHIRAAVEFQYSRHAHGKVVIKL